MSARLHKSYSNNFTITPNHIINDDRISLKAKGVYLFLISKPENWSFSVERIAKQNKDGEDSVKTALKELEKFGYLKRIQANNRGYFGMMDYIISDVPQPSGENPPTDTVRGKTATGKTATGKSPDIVKKRVVKKNIEREKTDLSDFSNPDEAYTAEIVETSDRLSQQLFPHLEQFLDFVCKSSRIKNKLAYRSVLVEALLDPKNKRHKKTLYAYETFSRKSAVNNFPGGFDVFGVYESLGFGGGSHV